MADVEFRKTNIDQQKSKNTRRYAAAFQAVGVDGAIGTHIYGCTFRSTIGGTRMDKSVHTPFGGPSNAKSITQMAARYGVSLRTLRFYEDRQLLFPQRIGLARFYSPLDEIRLQLVQKGKRLGFALAEIEALIFKDCTALKEADQLSEREEISTWLTEKQILNQIDVLEQRRDNICAAIDELRGAYNKESSE